jgi:CRP-like cAMP-binding protein
MTDSFWSNIFGSRVGEPELRERLRRVPVFSSLNARQLAGIERILHHRQYSTGEAVFKQGDPGVGMYVVMSGTVEIVYEPTGRVLAELSTGDFFGEIALLTERPRSATARARSDCSLLGFFHVDLLNLLESNPRAGVVVLRALAEIAGARLIRADERIRDLEERVAELEESRASSEGPGNGTERTLD